MPATPKNSDAPAAYVGRFAPTPSGPLHLGSLLTATASWLDARSRGGTWLLRIDDLDGPRIAPGAEATILRTLEAHGLVWDGPIVYQHAHVERYRAALAKLRERCFACACTRAQLRGQAIYPGTCRNLGLPFAGNAVRLRVGEEAEVAFQDRIQGHRHQCLASAVGDFAIWRRDDMATYPLAVVVDDAAMNVTNIVRGADLLADTPRQLHLARLLHLPAPTYAHVPVVVEASGVKLSKHNATTAIDDRAAPHNMATVLGLLGLAPPLAEAPTQLAWARRRWRAETLPAHTTLPGFVALA